MREKGSQNKVSMVAFHGPMMLGKVECFSTRGGCILLSADGFLGNEERREIRCTLEWWMRARN